MMSKKFKQYLQVMQHLPMDKQKEQLEQLFNSWKGNYAQVDDVLVVGIKI